MFSCTFHNSLQRLSFESKIVWGMFILMATSWGWGLHKHACHERCTVGEQRMKLMSHVFSIDTKKASVKRGRWMKLQLRSPTFSLLTNYKHPWQARHHPPARVPFRWLAGTSQYKSIQLQSRLISQSARVGVEGVSSPDLLGYLASL